jgi:hypothetical protein
VVYAALVDPRRQSPRGTNSQVYQKWAGTQAVITEVDDNAIGSLADIRLVVQP